MGVEQFARIARDSLDLEFDDSDDSWTIFFVPSGGLKDAQKGFPRIKFVHQDSDGRISAIVNFKKVDGSYQLESACSPDYSRLSHHANISNEVNRFELSEEELLGSLETLASLSGQKDVYDIFQKVVVQTALSYALEKEKDPNVLYKIH
ncbi:hypothetical protein HYT53_02120 [Candidatus Woesearchaeota archaeon]|nr:hypothetical protein [Candidatus Woesearchaeota archaeon]